MYLPHDVFRRMLSFKDPRYEKVRSGASKPCWRPWSRRFEEPRNFKVCGHYIEFDEYPEFRVYGVQDKRFHSAKAVEDLEDRLDGLYWMGETPTNRPPTLAQLSLQCEACGDDLFVHDYSRHVAATNK